MKKILNVVLVMSGAFVFGGAFAVPQTLQKNKAIIKAVCIDPANTTVDSAACKKENIVVTMKPPKKDAGKLALVLIKVVMDNKDKYLWVGKSGWVLYKQEDTYPIFTILPNAIEETVYSGEPAGLCELTRGHSFRMYAGYYVLPQALERAFYAYRNDNKDMVRDVMHRMMAKAEESDFDDVSRLNDSIYMFTSQSTATDSIKPKERVERTNVFSHTCPEKN